MASRVQPTSIGVDVSKAELAIAMTGTAQLITLPNNRAAIRAWLKSLTGPVILAVEATNTFHLLLLAEAHRRHHTLYVVDGYRLSRYRDSVGVRAKNDAKDAQLILRYLLREQDQLRPWTPPPQAYDRLHRLLRRRATLVKAKVAVRQSLTGIPALHADAQQVLAQMETLDRHLQKKMQAIVQHANWRTDVQRCQAIEGIGPLTATALVTAFHRGRFQSSDAFIAFLGLDVRVRDSGAWRGRRKLTKQGDSELRRLLHNAAMAAKRNPIWAAFCQRYQARGLKPIQILVILARKLARIAFALMKNQSTYQPAQPPETCMAT